MKRNKPMKRTGFQSANWPFARKPPKVIDDNYYPKPRATAVAVTDGKARMVVPVPKFSYIRDLRLRDMCRAIPCQHCGKSGPDAGVTWAHSNQAIHGKAGAKKASDVYVAAMCAVCHAELDQGKTWTQDERVAIWNAAHQRTVALAVATGLWPSGIGESNGLV